MKTVTHHVCDVCDKPFEGRRECAEHEVACLARKGIVELVTLTPGTSRHEFWLGPIAANFRVLAGKGDSCILELVEALSPAFQRSVLIGSVARPEVNMYNR